MSQASDIDSETRLGESAHSSVRAATGESYQARLAQAREVMQRAEKSLGLAPTLTLQRNMSCAGPGRDASEGLQVVRGAIAPQLRPCSSSVIAGESFAVPSALEKLLPGGLPAGQVVNVSGSTSVLFALAAHAAGTRGWCAALGLTQVGWAAVADLGIDLGRTIVIPGDKHLIKALDIVLESFPICILGPQVAITSGQRRTLEGKIRQRKALVLAYKWPQAPLALQARPCSGQGMRSGAGRIRSLRWEISLTGKSAARQLAHYPDSELSLEIEIGPDGHLHPIAEEVGEPVLSLLTSPGRGEGGTLQRKESAVP